jgi:hypothetical protein
MSHLWNAIARLVVGTVWGLDRVTEWARVTADDRDTP